MNLLVAALVGSALIGVILAAVLAFLIARGTSRRIARLADGTRRLAAGDLEHRIENAGEDELGELAGSFNAMADELERMHADLELRVAERTAELESRTAALAESETRTRLIVETALDAIITIDHRGRITEFNPAAERTLGYRRDEVIGQVLGEIIVPPRLRESHRAGLERHLETGQARILGRRIELPALRKDGAEIVAELTVTRMPLAGPPSFTGFLRDVTEARRAQEELRGSMEELREARSRAERQAAQLLQQASDLERARDQALEATRVKSGFLANMSHEIRTPLNSLMGMTSLLQDTDLALEQREYAEAIHSCSKTLLAIINDILDFSKIEAGRMTLEVVEFDPRDLTREAVTWLASRAAEKQLRLECRVDDGLPRRLMGDPVRLRQVLMNLVGNAIKFTATGGVNVRVGGRPDGPGRFALRIEVDDTGIGIPPDQHHSVFESFTQADGSTTRRFGGTGLGLAICRQLVELMRGRIGLTSEPGQGSTFWVEVSLLAASPSAGSPDDDAPAADRLPWGGPLGISVLVAEDNEINQMVAARILTKWGCRVEVVTHGRAVLEALERAAYDAVLMDVQMPGMDGLEVTAEIRRREAQSGRRVPIIAVTGSAIEGDRESCLAAGMDDYLPKPLDARALWTTLAGVTRRAGPTEESNARPGFGDVPGSKNPREAPASTPRTPDAALPVAAIFQFARLRQLVQEDADFERQLLHEFEAAVPDMVRGVFARFESGDGRGAQRAAHALRGSCLTMGAEALAATAAEIERRCEQGDLESARALAPRLEAELRRVAEVLGHHLRGRAA